MEKIQTQGQYNKEFLKSQQKVRTKNGKRQGKNSNGYKEPFTNENESMVRNSSNLVERKSIKTSSQASIRETRRQQGIKKNVFKKSNSNINFIDEFPTLSDVDKNSEFSETRKSKKINADKHFPSLNQYINNECSESRKQGIKNNVFKKPSTRINFEDEFPPLKVDINTEFSETRSNNGRISVNEDLSSLNQDMDNKHSEARNNLSRTQNYNATACESNCNNRQIVKYDLPNGNMHSDDLSVNNVHDDQKTYSINKNSVMVSESQKGVPSNKSLSYEDIHFSNFDLTDLLYYNVNLMQDQQLYDYAFSLKCKILEKIHKFKYPERDELEFLCALTDGTQTEKNQRLITARTLSIIDCIFEQSPPISDCPTPYPLQLSNPLQTSDCTTTPYSLQISDFPVSNPPQTSDCLTTPYSLQISDFSSNSPEVSDFLASNPPQISNFPTAPNSPQMSDSYSNNYGSHIFEEVQNSDLPLGPDMEFNKLSEYYNGQNADFNTDDAHKNSAIDSSVSNIVENVYVGNVAKESIEHNCMHPIVSSEESVSISTSLLTYEDGTFSNFGLDNLLNYDVDAMQGQLVLDYAFAMKERILEKIHGFRNPVKEKLEFLCEITDGTQKETNQKLITARMIYLINSYHTHQSGRKYSAGYSRYANPRRSRYSHSGRKC